MVRALHSEARAGRSYSFMVWQGKNLVGQITMGGVIYGALRGAHIGYWIDKNYAGRGLTTDAVNTLTRFAFEGLALHRIEINIRPENAASIRVAEKAGYTFESDRPEFLHIAGAWRDHKSFVKVNDLVK
jgi:ribosomal-protein-alanine N-acetyltransferase